MWQKFCGGSTNNLCTYTVAKIITNVNISELCYIVKSHNIFSVRSAITEADNDTSEDFLSLRVKTEEEKVSAIYLFMHTIQTLQMLEYLQSVTNLLGERGS